MVSRTQKKILLAIDGSDQSLNAVRYVSELLASQKPEVVLFHVMRKIDETFWDLGIDPAYHERVADVSAWALEQEKTVQGFMNCASQILFEAGIPEESVTAKIHESKAGVARDIIKESMNGYSGVVVGRKGLSKLKDLLLGSVAHKLVEKLRHVPIWVVGGTPQLGRILLALDGSEGAMKAVDHVGTLLAGSDYEVTLLHVMREVNWLICQKEREDYIPSELEASLEEKWFEDERLEMGPVFDVARIRLINAGFDPNRVTTKLIRGVSSRAGGIVEEAKLGGYGSIVVGRRGLSRVEDFFMGRVSNKVVHLVKDMAVWVVS